MTSEQPSITLGFFSVLDIEDLGYCGGLLILNQVGRPIEFHCTLPIKPSRTQEILFGDSLKPLLFGESIGGSLIQKTKVQADILWVDSEDAIHVASLANCPVACVSAAADDEAQDPQEKPPLETVDYAADETTQTHARFDSMPFETSKPADDPHLLRFGNHTIRPSDHGEFARNQVTEVLAQLDNDFSLVEPFSRIREAIHEAQAVSR